VTDPIVIAPTGELDLQAAREVAPTLTEAAGQLDRPVVVDLSEVTFLDSTALGAVVQTDSRMQRSGRRLAVVAPTGSAAAVLLDLTQLRSRLLVLGSREAALQAA
jgi:anti-sigma B factor antagonist